MNHLPRFLLITCLFLAPGAVIANTDEIPENNSLQEIVFPDTSSLKQPGRDILNAARKRFEEVKAGESELRELGLAYGQLGMFYQAQQIDTAQACYHNAMILVPDDFRWPYYLAFAYEEKQDWSNAINFYKRSLLFNPGYTPSYLRMAVAALGMGDLETASKSIDEVMARLPNSAAAISVAGQIASAKKDNETAVALYEKALKLAPEASQLHYLLGLAYRETGDLNKARAELALKGDRVPSSPDAVLTLMTARVLPAQDYADRGVNNAMQGNPDKARSLLKLALSIDPENLTARSTLGQILLSQGETAAARTQFDSALAIDNEDAIANLGLGRIYEAQGNDPKAIAHYELAMADSQQEILATRLLVAALMRAQQYDRASTVLDLSLTRNVDNAALAYLHGLVLLAQKKCLDAQSRFEQSFIADQTQPESALAMVRVYASCGSEDKRAMVANMARQLDEVMQTSDSQEAMAMALAATGKYPEATQIQQGLLHKAAARKRTEDANRLRENMRRYQSGNRAEWPWPIGSNIFKPPRNGIAVQNEGN